MLHTLLHTLLHGNYSKYFAYAPVDD